MLGVSWKGEERETWASDLDQFLNLTSKGSESMYHLLSGIYSEWTKKKQFSILLIGQGSVGKTSLLEGIKSDYTQTPSIPIDRITKTVGQNGKSQSHLNS